MLARGTPGPGRVGLLRNALAAAAAEERRCCLRGRGTACPSARCQMCCLERPLSWPPRGCRNPELNLEPLSSQTKSPEGHTGRRTGAQTSLETAMSYGAKSFCVRMAGKPARNRGEAGGWR